MKSMKSAVDRLREMANQGALEPSLKEELEQSVRRFEHGYATKNRDEMLRAVNCIARAFLRIELPH